MGVRGPILYDVIMYLCIHLYVCIFMTNGLNKELLNLKSESKPELCRGIYIAVSTT